MVAKRTFKIGLNAEVTGAEALAERAGSASQTWL